ncbi:MAG TPA: beta-Ig-H3/fasciclin, partial [Planctomycetaceae bacterium]|nr:beta-Ig-H3/fasciclin [Planctomycetaceae bacterium]
MRQFFKSWAFVIAIGFSLSATLGNAAEKDIVDTAVGAGNFKTLAAALGAADLVGALKGKGP